MTGIRKGAIPFLRVGSLKKVTEYFDVKGQRRQLDNHVYKLTVYEGEDEEYYTFMTNEAAKALETYLELRRQAGEEITPDSPLIRDAFNPFNVKEPKPITIASLDMMFTRMLRATGLRISNGGGENRQDRHDVMLFHGIRKYVNHCYVNARVDPIKKELLQGHTIRLEGSYLKPTENEMLLEWLKAVDALSLTEEEILRSKNKRLSAENEDIAAARKGYAEMNDRVDNLTSENKMLQRKNDLMLKFIILNSKILGLDEKKQMAGRQSIMKIDAESAEEAAKEITERLKLQQELKEVARQLEELTGAETKDVKDDSASPQ